MLRRTIQRNIYDSLSPLDYRYYEEAVARYLSEEAFIRYKLQVELAAMETYARRGLCPLEAVEDVRRALKRVTAAAVYQEEKRTKHDIRAMANVLARLVKKQWRRFIHLGATSYDIVDTANAMRFRDVIIDVVIPELKKCVAVLCDITVREADTIQIGRTHGQHAVPITFGFTMAEYVSRLGEAILQLEVRANALTGKFSGAVGAYNATSLFVPDPEEFEREMLASLGLKPAGYSSQIVPADNMVRLLSEIAIIAGIIGDFSESMRHLQRTEIGEVGEAFDETQVGSSTMPHKRNPINFENISSVWKIILTTIGSAYIQLVSEHQRDLTGSAISRTNGEAIDYLVPTTVRMTRVLKKLVVDKENLRRNLAMSEGAILAEPMYLILASLGHSNAHEAVRKLTLQAEKDGITLQEAFERNRALKQYRDQLTDEQRRIISDPMAYIGRAPEKARATAEKWRNELNLTA